MSSDVIIVENLTKDYGNQKGIFTVDFRVKSGEILGFLGPNGAGKTTTIRHLMGFLKPDKGICKINNLDCLKDSANIQQNLGYLPGEISFFDDMRGMELIRYIGSLRGMKDYSKAEKLIERFELDTKGKIKKMSKGMKQKVGLVCAFMHNPQVLILDEPTSGLDPLMQNRFVELVMEEKQQGKTILMSSHMFDEIEKTCERVVIIKLGHIVTVEKIETLKSQQIKTYNISFSSNEDAEKFLNEIPNANLVSDRSVKVCFKGDINEFIKILSKYKITSFDSEKQNLEQIFMHYYSEKEGVMNV